MAVINIAKRVISEDFWKKTISKKPRIFVENLMIKNEYVDLTIVENIKSVYITLDNKIYSYLNFIQEGDHLYLKTEDIMDKINTSHNRYDLMITNMSNKQYNLELRNILYKHVKDRYFKLSEKDGYVYTIYSSITGKIKLANLSSGQFKESTKITGVIKTDIVKTNIISDEVISFKLKVNDETTKINRVLLHDDILKKAINLRFIYIDDIIEVLIKKNDLINNGWISFEINSNIYQSLGVKINDVYHNSDLFDLNDKERVTRLVPSYFLRSKLRGKISNFNMSIDDNNWKWNFPSFHISQSKRICENPLVTIIVPNWNNGPYLKRAMDSIVNQTIGLNNIEIIFVDDLSSDHSRSIMDQYVNDFPNFKVVKLDENTGAAATPRNIGLTLMRGKYLALLDPDDWYNIDGIKKLIEGLELSGDDFAIGAMIEKNGEKYKRVYAGTSFQESHGVDINELPVPFFSWMGPQSILVRSEIIKKNNLHFPEMRTSDDQKFFMDALLISKKITQLKNVINYVNHDEDNISLMTLAGKTTEIFDNAIRLWTYLINLNAESEAIHKLISRKLEIQFERYFYFSGMRQVLNESDFEQIISKFQWIKSEIGFDPSKYFEVNDHKVAWKLLIEDQELSKALNFIDWAKLSMKFVPTFIKDKIIYRDPREMGEQPIPYNCIVRADSVEKVDDGIKLNLNIYSKNNINSLVLRESKGEQLEHEIEILKTETGNYYSIISDKFIESLGDLELYLYVRWNSAYYATVNFADLVAYNYDDLREVGFFKSGQRLGFRVRPILYSNFFNVNSDNIEINIRIEGYYSEIIGIKFENTYDKEVYYLSNKLDKDGHYYLFDIDRSELNKLSTGNYIIRMIYDRDRSIPVGAYSISNEALLGTGLFENKNHNLEFRKG
ncbi:glycosyltransferase family 2 protein [Weissella coleopterorum]|uniref:Glycosyltransferase family 2 protein n=1 Tax=Weissella coleopterorum TaxID=2714949 RepID=A0A6G8B0D2_9LACO|nr:glycosyltransferase family 2 protein [Weissella coleopterorum]QIL50801.1 glycosyltransferase family 2 protein [Weissella coleopterorum]